MKPHNQFVQEWIEGARGAAKIPQPELTVKKQGWGRLRNNLSVHATPLCLDGQAFRRGLGTHADSEISVELPAPARTFFAVVGVDDNTATRQATKPCELVFSLEVEHDLRWTSPTLTRSDGALEVEVDLGGALEFVLKVHDVNGSLAYAHADWVEARVVLDNGESLWLSHEGRHIPNRPPISFQYGGRSFLDSHREWTRHMESSAQEDETTLHRITYMEPATGLQCSVEMTQFPDFPAVEYMVRFKNTGSVDTPLLEAVRALDFDWEAHANDILLHRSRGSRGQIEDFLLQSEYLHRRETFEESQNIAMVAGKGRSSQEWLPFFNVQTGHDGFFTAIGWSGEWKAEFLCSDGIDVHVNLGMEQTHLRLHPGEEIRTPRILLLFWEGEVQETHNLLRRFLLRYHTPQAAGQPAHTPICCATWGGVKTASHLKSIETFLKHRLEYDCYWVDAGWYGVGETDCPDVFVGDWASQTGNWNINRYRHPDGLRPISESAHTNGMQFLLWFELQRAIVGTNLPEQHPDWFFPRQEGSDNLLLNLGHPEALQWCVDTVSCYINDQGLDWYRQDYNIDPLAFWRAADAPNRQGISEIRNIEGLYAFWDELLRRHPRLRIDNCASGGRCLDLETIGRSTALWRSDYQCFTHSSPTGLQVQFVGLSHWLPLHAGGTLLDSIGDTYAFRSAISSGISDQLTMFESKMPRDEKEWAWARQMLKEQKRLRPYFMGDFYALTTPSASPEAWCAYQMHRPEQGEGFVMAFRREQSPFEQATFNLKGLDAETRYILEDVDTGFTWTAFGSELLDQGLTLKIDEPRSSKVICIH